MRRLEAVAGVLGCGLLLAGCVPAEADDALRAADDFQSLVAASNWPGACARLSEDARTGLEAAAARPCGQALSALHLADDPAGGVEVWGHNARAWVGTGALFLSRYADGWRVVAAGCESRGEDRPHACAVRG